MANTANPETTLRDRIRTGSQSSCLTTVAVTVASYAVLELIHHGVIATYITPWLATMFVSLNVTYASFALAGLVAIGAGYLIWKAFVQQAKA